MVNPEYPTTITESVGTRYLTKRKMGLPKTLTEKQIKFANLLYVMKAERLPHNVQ